ncbi:carbon-nitrogen family hydrolase [Bacillus timonensis]|uniref:Carbon-nitrogen family hydrolase n=1 Tax=Bacillus timonensis TaxID=1033734 RepID=A0A4S3PKZ0_9BACI|nr:carbon-nitrogen family hydrolase [Bacillus timonensis]THE09685.1 carbon-nitrogen family hydrolase [Bacillus timonensis]
MNLKIACIQYDIQFGKPQENFDLISIEIEKTMNQDAPDVIVLPELWTTGYDLTRLDEIADDHGNETYAFIGDLAKKYSVNIVAGSIAKKTEHGVTNTMFVFNREGEIISEYSKLHLFQLMDEHLYLQAGEAKGAFTIETIPAAGVICYDIRFPEWIRAHTSSGAEILFVVAEWPLPRLEHWRTLLLSRAIENQCYVVACNSVGSNPDNVFGGHSMIIDPWGTIIAEADTESTTLIGEIDLSKVQEVRKQIPIFQDRRPDFYK